MQSPALHVWSRSAVLDTAIVIASRAIAESATEGPSSVLLQLEASRASSISRTGAPGDAVEKLFRICSAIGAGGVDDSRATNKALIWSRRT